MVELRNVEKPVVARASSEAIEAAVVTEAEAVVAQLPGSAGEAAHPSRSAELLVGFGKSGPLLPAFESVIGVDERVRILDTNLAPWRMICALRMKSPTGGMAIGTGWLVGPRTVLTAGHCVFSSSFFGGWAETIEVIPGLNGTGEPVALRRPFGSVHSKQFSSVDRWVEHEDADFDIGCIHLQEDIGTALGWFGLASVSAAELESRLVNVSGYPADRGAGNEQYFAKNRVLRVTDRRIFYEVDTMGGQSGAPVWMQDGPDLPLVAVGIHAYGIGGTPANLAITANSAPRLIPEVVEQVAQWIAKDTPVAAA